MTDQEKFEQSWQQLNDTDGSFTEIAQIEFLKIIEENAAEIAQLQLDNQKLRKALEACKYDCHTGEVIGIAAEALSTTPAQSLTDHDNEIIEQFSEADKRRCICELKGKP